MHSTIQAATLVEWVRRGSYSRQRAEKTHTTTARAPSQPNCSEGNKGACIRTHCRQLAIGHSDRRNQRGRVRHRGRDVVELVAHVHSDGEVGAATRGAPQHHAGEVALKGLPLPPANKHLAAEQHA